MFITPWREEDDKSYWECFASIREGTSQIFKLRAVRNSEGTYSACVRDFGSGKLMASTSPHGHKGFHLDKAQMKVLELAQMVLIFEGSDECIIIKHWICPHKSISGKHCSVCKLPDAIPKKMAVAIDGL